VGGWAELNGAGQYVAEVSPYEADLDWDDLTEPAELTETVADLARIVARMHGAADVDSDDPLVGFSAERAILRVVGGDDEGFTLLLKHVRPGVRRPDPRRPSALRRPLPQR